MFKWITSRHFIVNRSTGGYVVLSNSSLNFQGSFLKRLESVRQNALVPSSYVFDLKLIISSRVPVHPQHFTVSRNCSMLGSDKHKPL